MSRRRWGLLLLTWLGTTPAAWASTRPGYGGEAVVYVLGGPFDARHPEPESFAEASLRGAIYEPLYRLRPDGSVEPVLAEGLPEFNGNEATVRLKAGVRLHDGRTLDPELVITALRAPGGPLESLLWVAGARDPRGPVGLSLAADAPAIIFRLIAPFPELARALAAPGQLLAVPNGQGGFVGTGPFRPESFQDGGARLVPFLDHRDGRPLIEVLEWKRHASRAGGIALLRRGEAAVLLGADARGPAPAAPLEVLILDASALPLPGLDAPTHHDLLNAALDRERLVARFLGDSARPARQLDGGVGLKPGAHPAPPAGAQLRLRVPKDAPIPLRFLERLQLDLLRSGLPLTLDREPGPGRGPALGLDFEPLWAGPGDDPVDRLSALLALAHRHQRLDLVPEAELIAFLAADRAGRGQVLDRLELALRRGAGLIPIAVRRAQFAVRADLLGLEPSTHGPLRFDEVRLLEPP